MTITQTPLEKQLVNLDLSKGMDERTRPELTSGLTAVYNLVQDQSGAWVKRNGLTALGTTAIAPVKMLRTRDGLAAVTTDGTMSQYQEYLGDWLSKGTLPPFSVEKADLVTSSGPNATPNVYAAASSTKYHAVVTACGLNSSGKGIAILNIYDREAGATVGTYDLATVAGGDVTTLGQAIRICFIADRYLAVFLMPDIGSGTHLYGFTIDTNAALPVNSAAISKTTLHTIAGTVTSVNDVAVYTDRALVSFTDSTTSYILSMDTAGALIQKATTASVTHICVSGTNVWYVAGANIGAKLVTNLSTVTVAAAASGAGATVTGFGVDSTGVSWIVVQSAKSIGSPTVVSCAIWKANSANATSCTLYATIDGWKLVKHPFVAADGKMYAHMSKSYVSTQAASLTPHAVVCLTDKCTVYWDSHSYNSIRIGCTLEPFVAADMPIGNVNTPLRDFSIGGLGVEFNPVLAIQTVQRGFGFAAFVLKLFKYDGITTKVFGGSNYISGGTHVSYAGSTVSEADFLDYPIMAAVQGAAGAIGAGLFKFIAVYRCVDETGAVAYSRCSDPYSVTLAASKKADLTILPCAVTNRDPFGNAVPGSSPVSIDVYRTLAGGTQYYLCASSQASTPSGSLLTQVMTLGNTGMYTVSDNLTDAQLATQPSLFRQPGTVNSALDRYPPPCGKILCQHKDRLFAADPYGQRVYYSSFFVDGETAWYAPAFSFYVHGASGPITAIASMDGRLVVFKRDGIFLIDGDGPPEGGPSGNEYSPPQRIATEYGCIDQNSLVLTTEGLVYRSTRGIELLTRNMQVKWIGDAVQNTVSDNPKTNGVCLDTFGRLHMLVSTNSAPGQTTVSGETGADIVWDIPAGCWSVNYYTPHAGVYGRALQSCCIANLYGKGEVVVFADADSGTWYGDDSLFLDNTVYVPTLVETGWIRSTPQARQRIYGALLLAKKLSGSNHAVRINLAYNYVDSYTQTYVWEPDVINALDIEELLLKPVQQQVLAIRMRIEDIEPSDTGTYPVGTGAGCAMLGVCFEAAQLNNAPFANRGTVGVLSTPPRLSAISPDSGGSGGGTSVTLYGVDFTPSTTVTIGGVALSSLVYVSSNVMTGVTPSGTIGTADVVANNAGGAGTLVDGFTYTSATFDPATFELELWYKGYTTLPWVSTPSAGASEWGGTMVIGAGSTPAAGTLNGYGTMVLSGTEYLRNLSDVSSGLFRSSSGGVMFLFKVTGSPAAPSGNIYDDKNMVMDSNATLGFSVTSSGITGFVYAGGYVSLTKVAAAGWHVGYMSWDGVDLVMDLDSLGPSSTACGAILLPLTNMYLGYQYGVGAGLEGEIAELLCWQSTPSPTDYANFKSYCNSKYGLAL